jgi:MYXO-CTERM domain-containing protein
VASDESDGGETDPTVGETSDEGGCGCSAQRTGVAALLFFLLPAALRRRRRR